MTCYLATIFTSGLLPLSSCKSPQKSIQPNPSVQSAETLNNDGEIKVAAIQIAREFLKTAYGQAEVDNLRNKDFPPKATFYRETNRWDVFFTNGVGSISVELDKELTAGNISRLDGKIYKRDPSDKVSIYKMPLFTLAEFKKIVKLPHNQFED